MARALSANRQRTPLKPGRKKEILSCYLLLALPLIGYCLFDIYPIFWQLHKAFFRYTGVPSDTMFVGWKNFIDVFVDTPKFWEAYLVTVQFTLIKVPVELTIAIFIASLLSREQIKGKSIFRAIYYIPVLLSAVVIGVIYSNFFNYFGVINDILLRLGLVDAPVDFFQKKWVTMSTLIGGHVWNNVGTNVLYFTAALANIPKDCYEAAYLDGASRFTTFRKITLPLMGPVLSTILLLSFLGTLGVGEYILVTSAGMPAGETQSVSMFMLTSYMPGFATGTINIGFASALTFVYSIISLILSMSFRKLSSWLTSRT